jgi:hypothetical protein
MNVQLQAAAALPIARNLQYPLIRVLMDSRVDMDAVEKKQMSCPCLE